MTIRYPYFLPDIVQELHRIPKNQIVAVVGDPPKKFAFGTSTENPLYEKLIATMRKEIIKLYIQGKTVFLSSLERGVPLWGASIIQELRQYPQFAEMELVAVTSHQYQSAYYPPKDEAIFFNILSACSGHKQITVMYTRETGRQRDLFMAEAAHTILAVTPKNKRPAGAAHKGRVIKFAIDQYGGELVGIDPVTYEIFSHRELPVKPLPPSIQARRRGRPPKNKDLYT